MNKYITADLIKNFSRGERCFLLSFKQFKWLIDVAEREGLTKPVSKKNLYKIEVENKSYKVFEVHSMGSRERKFKVEESNKIDGKDTLLCR